MAATSTVQSCECLYRNGLWAHTNVLYETCVCY